MKTKKTFKSLTNQGLLTVDLSHGPNPDVEMPGSPMGYWSTPIARGSLMRTCCVSLEFAQKRCRQYIERNAIGGGNWTGGLLCVDGEPIGRVSYNGRAWDLEDKELTEIPRP
jgi:hypothetical protein